MIFKWNLIALLEEYLKNIVLDFEAKLAGQLSGVPFLCEFVGPLAHFFIFLGNGPDQTQQSDRPNI